MYVQKVFLNMSKKKSDLLDFIKDYCRFKLVLSYSVKEYEIPNKIWGLH